MFFSLGNKESNWYYVELLKSVFKANVRLT